MSNRPPISRFFSDKATVFSPVTTFPARRQILQTAFSIEAKKELELQNNINKSSTIPTLPQDQSTQMTLLKISQKISDNTEYKLFTSNLQYEGKLDVTYRK